MRKKKIIYSCASCGLPVSEGLLQREKVIQTWHRICGKCGRDKNRYIKSIEKKLAAKTKHRAGAELTTADPDSVQGKVEPADKKIIN